MSGMLEKHLFGGAIIINLPGDAFDLSTFRQVPDHEEAFAHPITDQSIMIELLEYFEGEDHEAAEYFFKDLAAANNSENDFKINTVNQIEHLKLPNCDSIWFLNGTQSVSKYNETAKNLVNINLVVFRYSQFITDILITFNDPSNINPLSSSHSAAIPVHSTKWSLEQFNQIITSFNILDFNLFKN